ncbi:MAG: hypothetical protein IT207_01690 [Fimbriimonadaceae bacterium]|nr:hypothetical protein [Fimbriimonadaceae bacterium]
MLGATDPDVRDKLVSNVRKVQARGGVSACRDDGGRRDLGRVGDETVRVPATDSPYLDALLTVVPLQPLAFHMVREQGCEIDQPRNLAESITVE